MERPRARKRKYVLLSIHILFSTCQSFTPPPDVSSITHAAARSREINVQPTVNINGRIKTLGFGSGSVSSLGRIINVPHRRRRLAFHHPLSSKSQTVEEWTAGDWELDLQALRSAVALSNAPTDLAQRERLDLLDEFSRQRRDLIPDVMRFVMRPCAAAIALVAASKSSVLRRPMDYFARFMNASFWVSSVYLPILLHLVVKKRNVERRRKSEWEAEYINPREDCSDYSRCLLENWAFSAYPSALVGIVTLCSYFINNSSRKGYRPILVSWQVAMGVSQLLTRLGSAACIHQFPMYLYQLRTEHKKGPVPRLQSILRTLIDSTLWVLPLGFASDLAQLYNYILNMDRVQNLLSLASIRGGRNPLMIRTVLVYSIFVSSVLMQLCQLVAFQKLVRIGQFAKVSLATDPKQLRAMLEDPNLDETDMFKTKLRYKLHWREPKRLFSSFRTLLRDFTLFLFTGWGEDASILEQSKRTPHLLKLVQKEMDENPHPFQSYRTDWIPNATKRMRDIHQENYEKKTFDDPLGIALQQTFGIGLSFDFDHNSLLAEGEYPSVHRLRARAAKSAIKRYHEIPDLVKQEFNRDGGGDDDNGSDESAAKTRKKQIKAKIKEERIALKNSVMGLLSMIPSNAPAPEGKPLDVLSMRQSEVATLSGVANLPFLRDDNDDGNYENGDDSNGTSKNGNEKDAKFIVKDPYLDDDIFSSDGEGSIFA